MPADDDDLSVVRNQWMEKQRRWRLTRDGLLVLLGTLLLAQQALSYQLTGATEPALITAGSSIVLSPLLLHRDERR
jgi:hypothetical protein